MFELYKAIWRISARRQVVLIFISISVAALAAAPLEFQKRIVNGLEGRDIDVAQLVTLCLGMLGVICISLLLKWLLGVMSSILGEDMIRRIRTALLGGAVQQDGTRVRGGTLATTVAAEAEELGKFTGGAFSEPVVQVGTLLSVIGYIAATQPVLGVIAVCMLIPQVLLVLVTQRKVNELVAERVRLLRGATDEMVSKSIKDAEQAALDAFDKIYSTRKSMFIWKLSTKFVLSLINGIGTVSVLLLGGFYVLRGNGDVGTVVAATIGLGRLQSPTSFMIAFYRTVSSTRVKFELLRDLGIAPTQMPAKAKPLTQKTK